MRTRSNLALLVLTLLVFSCSGQEEQSKRQSFQADADLIDRSLEQTQATHQELQAHTNNLRVLLEDMDAELGEGQKSAATAGAASSNLRFVFFKSEDELNDWALPASGPNTSALLIIAVFLFGLWMLWRLRNQRTALLMDGEIHRVIMKLKEEAKASTQGPTSAPLVRPTKTGPPPPDPSPPAPAKAESREEPETDHQAGASVKAAAVENVLSEPPVEEKPLPDPRAVAPETIKQRVTTPNRQGTKDKKESRRKSSRPSSAKNCKVKGCKNKHRSKGFCNKHYQQWRRGNLTEEIE